ncbi:MAG: hypothetical protein ACMXYG_04695, partial [Candidatus Woesearchaeota archaeon]
MAKFNNNLIYKKIIQNKNNNNNNKRNCFCIFAILLLTIIIPTISASDVAYIYRSTARIDQNMVDVMQNDFNLNINYYNENNLPNNLSSYKFLIVTADNFRNYIPVNDYPSIIPNFFNGHDWGLVSNVGVSKLASNSPLRVEIVETGERPTVYTRATDWRGIALDFNFLSNENSPINKETIAKTLPISSGPTHEGDVVSIIRAGTQLMNGRIAGGDMCFYGILQSNYWTNDARELFKTCVFELLKECEVDSDCDDGIFCNGPEVCDENYQCQPGTPIECSIYNIDEITECGYDDGNENKFYSREEFISVC